MIVRPFGRSPGAAPRRTLDDQGVFRRPESARAPRAGGDPALIFHDDEAGHHVLGDRTRPTPRLGDLDLGYVDLGPQKK